MDEANMKMLTTVKIEAGYMSFHLNYSSTLHNFHNLEKTEKLQEVSKRQAQEQKMPDDKRILRREKIYKYIR